MPPATFVKFSLPPPLRIQIIGDTIFAFFFAFFPHPLLYRQRTPISYSVGDPISLISLVLSRFSVVVVEFRQRLSTLFFFL